MDHKIRAATLAAELRQMQERIKELEAERDTVIIAMDALRGATDLYRRSSAAWKRAAKKWYSYALFWERKKTDELARAIERARELEAENDRLGTAGMRARNRIAELEDYKELLKTRLKEECNRVLTNAKIAAGLEQENARLRQILARITAAASAWLLNAESFDGLGELMAAIDEAQAALLAGAEDTR